MQAALAEGRPELDSPKAQRILRGARGVLAEFGYGGASMSEIAARAGVSKGTLYNYFTDKEALFAACVADMCRRRAMPAFDIDVEADDIAAELRRVGTRMLAFTTDPETLAIFRVVIAEAHRFPELGRIFLDSGPRRGVARVAEALAELDRQGRLRVPDPGVAAWQFLMLCRGEAFYERVLWQSLEVDPDKARRTVDAAVELFMRGYRVREP